jgi:hypothetical protein
MIMANHEYHVVEFGSRHLPAEIFEWLQIKYGPGDGTRWWYRHPRLFFRNSSDHLMFLLSWSNN